VSAQRSRVQRRRASAVRCNARLAGAFVRRGTTCRRVVADPISWEITEAPVRDLTDDEATPLEQRAQPWIRASAVGRADEPFDLLRCPPPSQAHDHRDEDGEYALATAVYVGKFCRKSPPSIASEIKISGMPTRATNGRPFTTSASSSGPTASGSSLGRKLDQKFLATHDSSSVCPTIRAFSGEREREPAGRPTRSSGCNAGLAADLATHPIYSDQFTRRV
jgi:hypothetical protein